MSHYYFAADGSRTHEVTRLDRTTGGGVMNQLLFWGPVQMLEIGLADFGCHVSS